MMRELFEIRKLITWNKGKRTFIKILKNQLDESFLPLDLQNLLHKKYVLEQVWGEWWGRTLPEKVLENVYFLSKVIARFTGVNIGDKDKNISNNFASVLCFCIIYILGWLWGKWWLRTLPEKSSGECLFLLQSYI